ncbi:MAG: 4Fe-4S cluster-binding domain-containing protein [Candidatus Helarchaeota archaeon]|nr:4Fe-4S cluster-binding domain-containing protein [Candidatus Helarchaeota archaeon]
MTIITHHDYPYEGRPHRYYFAITTDCNRACPWCSTYSKPGKKSYLSREIFLDLLPKEGIFEVQFEGGEPTLHPSLLWMVKRCRETGRCHRIVLCTNGVLFPFKYKNDQIDINNSKISLKDYFLKFGEQLTIKLSLNHHLFEHDTLLFEKARIIVDVIEGLKAAGDFKVILNVRRRNSIKNNYDKLILEQLSHYALEPYSNIFFLQAYGKNKNNNLAEKPFLVGYNFTLFNPDGKSFGNGLITRSEAMKELP